MVIWAIKSMQLCLNIRMQETWQQFPLTIVESVTCQVLLSVDFAKLME
jgi:hypothetical protein